MHALHIFITAITCLFRLRLENNFILCKYTPISFIIYKQYSFALHGYQSGSRRNSAKLLIY